MSLIKFDYTYVPTVASFMKDRHRYKYIQGPIGSGKSSGCVMHLFNCMISQQPDSNKVRRTRYVIIRNTYVRLMDTTKITIDEWFPLSCGLYTWKEQKRTYLWKFALEDGTTVQSEWLLRALDDPSDYSYLSSLEITGAWLNEGREIQEQVFIDLRGRIGRYPPARIVEPTYPFIIIDSNPPSVRHWLYRYFVDLPSREEKSRELFAFFQQPSGLDPSAENVRNLRPNYYQDLMVGQDEEWINVFVHGKFGEVREGKPVFSSYRDSVHCTESQLVPFRGAPIIIGMDFGLYPAAVFCQYTPEGGINVYDELVSEEPTDVETFVKDRLLPTCSNKYFLFDMYIVGDPAGNARSAINFRTCFQILKSYGFTAYPAYTNSIHDRIRAVNHFLTREGAFLMSSSCIYLRKALNGEYHFRRLRVATEKYEEIPEKNLYSHVADALQYACLGYIPKRMGIVSTDNIIPVKQLGYGGFV